MNIKDFVANFTNYPILFLGSGFSQRYLQNSYSWSNLLLKASQYITDSDREFLKYRNNHTKDNGYNYEDVATDIEQLFEAKLDQTKDTKYSSLNEKYYNFLRQGVKVSRLKIYISEILSKLEMNVDKNEEYQTFIRAAKNIGSIITTNYDELIESAIHFTPYVGNNILLSNPYGAVYKVHGSVKDPASIIITHEDYQRFNDEYELIKAQLITLFIHNPIIFIGYRLQDKDINGLLSTIFKYVDYSSPLSQKIRKNFLVVEYDKGSNNQEIQELDLLIGSQNIKVNKLCTDDFAAIYDVISNLKLPVSAMDIRKIRNVVTDIYEGTSGIKVRIFDDDNSLNNNDKVLAIGSRRIISYEYMRPIDFINNYFDIIEEQDEDKIRAIDKLQIQNAQYFPIYGFSTIYPKLENDAKLKKIENNKIQSIKDKVDNNSKYENNHLSIKDILEDDQIAQSNRVGCIQYGLIHKNIQLDNLKEELQINKDGYEKTSYNSLLVIYDYLTYNSGENS